MKKIAMHTSFIISALMVGYFAYVISAQFTVITDAEQTSAHQQWQQSHKYSVSASKIYHSSGADSENAEYTWIGNLHDESDSQLVIEFDNTHSVLNNVTTAQLIVTAAESTHNPVHITIASNNTNSIINYATSSPWVAGYEYTLADALPLFQNKLTQDEKLIITITGVGNAGQYKTIRHNPYLLITYQ